MTGDAATKLLREEWARKLFNEFVTGEPGAWDKDSSWHDTCRTECYRVADELLADVEAYRQAVQRVEALARRWAGEGGWSLTYLADLRRALGGAS